MKAIKNAFIVIVNHVSIVRGSLFLRNRIENNPHTIGVLHLHFHQLVELTIGIMPGKTRFPRRDYLLSELGWAMLRRSGRHEVVFAVIA